MKHDLAAMLLPDAPHRIYGRFAVIPGTDRTAYFYKKEALAWLHMMRGFEWFAGSRATYKRLALSYWANYKRMKGGDK